MPSIANEWLAHSGLLGMAGRVPAMTEEGMYQVCAAPGTRSLLCSGTMMPENAGAGESDPPAAPTGRAPPS
jgi:hypothetical protein